MLDKTDSLSDRVYLVCLNPHCLSDKDRCLTTKTLHSHPQQCSPFYYPAEEIMSRPWMELEKYPADNLGIATRKKLVQTQGQSYITTAVNSLRKKIQASLKQLQQKMLLLYPEKQFIRCYNNVYNLEKIGNSLRERANPTYISSLISNNFSAQNYHVLLRLNDNYDDIRNAIESLNNKVMSNFDTILNRHRSYQTTHQGKRPLNRKINYGIYKSKFIASSKIEVQKSVVHFPKLKNIASFLPWIYTDKHFGAGSHEFKICSLKYPMVQNAGFTVLQEHDIDTYPYTHFKSLFNKQGKGFKLVEGEDIDQFIAETTVVILRVELGASPKAIIHDSQMRGVYECELKENRDYRMGVYGSGWSMQIIQLN